MVGAGSTHEVKIKGALGGLAVPGCASVRTGFSIDSSDTQMDPWRSVIATEIAGMELSGLCAAFAKEVGALFPVIETLPSAQQESEGSVWAVDPTLLSSPSRTFDVDAGGAASSIGR